MQLFRKIKTFRGESAFSTWLHRLAVNIFLMRLRKRAVKQTSLEHAEHEQGDSAPKEIGARDLVLAGMIDRLQLTDAVAKLPEGYRLILVLHDIQGFEHHEIAAQLKCSIGNSKSQLHKARMRLRKLLTQPEPAHARQKPDRLPPVHDRPAPVLKFLAGTVLPDGSNFACPSYGVSRQIRIERDALDGRTVPNRVTPSSLRIPRFRWRFTPLEA